jgi:hypothetical protein
MSENKNSETPQAPAPADTNKPRKGIGGFFRSVGDSVVWVWEAVGETVQSQLTKDVFKESPEECDAHFRSILQNLKLRDIVDDRVVSSNERKDIMARFSSEYEMKYFLITLSYMSRANPEKLNTLLRTETGKGLVELVTQVSIEMPNGAKKTLKDLVIEYEAMKQ